MTKEEIQKNSEHWYNKYKDAEKKIAELENKITDIKANCDYVLEGKEIEYREERNKLCADFENMKATLESKIAELKAELTKKADTNHSLVEQMATLESENAELEKENAELKELKKKKEEIEIMTNFCKTCKKIHTDQLTKAKKLLEQTLPYLDVQDTGGDELYDKIEQFLKGENIILEDAQAGNSPFDADKVFNKEMKAYPEEK